MHEKQIWLSFMYNNKMAFNQLETSLGTMNKKGKIK